MRSHTGMKTPIAILAGLVTLTVASPAQAQFPLDSTFSARPGGRLTLNIDPGGSIEVKAAADNRLRVHIDERRRCEPECRVEFDDDGRSVRIHAYHRDRPRNSRGDLSFRV